MTLALYTDGNRWLDGTKISFANATDFLTEATEADNIVRAELGELYPAHVNLWDASGSPEATPQIVRTIAAILAASFRYARKYSENTQDENTYAGRLYAMAYDLINRLKSGDLTLVDVTYDDTAIALSTADFYPNDQDEPAEDATRFRMGTAF